MRLRHSFFYQWLSCLVLTTASVQVMGQNEPPISEVDFWQDLPTVMSATRMAQTVNNAPLPVTVIDRRMIEASGAREIPELFRLVPGFIVGYHDGHTPSVSYHISNDRYSRQMQVLVDGRSIYTTAIGGIPWSTLNVTLDDIERIEVVRGPNSASYGANSFLGVINIITRHAVLDSGTSVKTNLGDEGVREVFLRHGAGVGKLDYRVTAGFIQDDGFQERLDNKRTQIASVRADYALSNTDMLTFGGGVGTGPRGVENRSSSTSLSPNREKTELNHHEHFRWEHTLDLGESVSVQFYHIFNRNFETFSTLPITLGSAGGLDWVVEPMPVDFSRRTDRYDLEFQHNVTLTDTLRAAWGGGLRDDQVWGAQNLMANKEVHNHLKHGFLNLEWDPKNNWLVNAGAMVEDYSATGTNSSPRVGVNYSFSPAHSIRLTASRAIRAPSMYEDAARYAYSGTSNYYLSGTNTLVAAGPDIYDEYTVGTGNAGVERITSHEFGYHGMPIPGRMELDVKIYKDDLRGLLGESGITPVPGDIDNKNYPVINRDYYAIEGVELEAKFTFVDRSSLFFGYAYTEVEEIYMDHAVGLPFLIVDSRIAPQNAFNLLYMKDFDRGYSAGVGYYFTDEIQGWESGSLDKVRDQVRRLDVKLARKLDLSGYKGELALSARNVLGKYEEMEILRPKASYPALNEIDSSVYVTLKMDVD